MKGNKSMDKRELRSKKTKKAKYSIRKIVALASIVGLIGAGAFTFKAKANNGAGELNFGMYQCARVYSPNSAGVYKEGEISNYYICDRYSKFVEVTFKDGSVYMTSADNVILYNKPAK